MAQSQAWRNRDASDTGCDIVEVKEEEVGSQKQAPLVYASPSKPEKPQQKKAKLAGVLARANMLAVS